MVLRAVAAAGCFLPDDQVACGFCAPVVSLFFCFFLVPLVGWGWGLGSSPTTALRMSPAGWIHGPMGTQAWSWEGCWRGRRFWSTHERTVRSGGDAEERRGAWQNPQQSAYEDTAIFRFGAERDLF